MSIKYTDTQAVEAFIVFFTQMKLTHCN